MRTLKKSVVGEQTRTMSGNVAVTKFLIVSNPLLLSFCGKPPACACTSDSGYYGLLNRGPNNPSYKVLINVGRKKLLRICESVALPCNENHLAVVSDIGTERVRRTRTRRPRTFSIRGAKAAAEFHCGVLR